MRRLRLGLGVLALLVAGGAAWYVTRGGAPDAPAGRGAGVPVAQAPRLGGPVAPAPARGGRPAAAGHENGDLDCRNCHLRSHQGVVQMYLGMGGHGVPTIPSHMLQVRVECIACHVAPKEATAKAELVGQTFRPTEEACLGCHGEKYRGMLGRWVTTLAKMREIMTAKLAGARAAVGPADPKSPRTTRAKRLLADAEANVQFVALAKGVHNVFYAADLLKVSNGWLDEAVALVGKSPTGVDDSLVRGGYCGVLCHEQAGVRIKETGAFRDQKFPHARHVSEFGATCTVCHSAELHKAVTATPATCSSCHHSPQNDRCEGCHRVQTEFYRGTLESDLVEALPNPMVDAVPCVGCHDFSVKHSRETVGQKCVACHEPPYIALHDEWTRLFDRDIARAATAVKQAQDALAASRRAGRAPEATRLLKEAAAALELARQGRSAHNPELADALLEAARRKADEARALAAPR